MSFRGILVAGGRGCMHPVPYTREAEELVLKLMEGKLDGMHDTHGVIRFHKVFE